MRLCYRTKKAQSANLKLTPDDNGANEMHAEKNEELALSKKVCENSIGWSKIKIVTSAFKNLLLRAGAATRGARL